MKFSDNSRITHQEVSFGSKNRGVKWTTNRQIIDNVRSAVSEGYTQCHRNSLNSNKKARNFRFSLSVPPQGLEPWTPTLRVSCSTN